jgi:hypothetical protein
MGQTSKKYSITDATGATATIPAYSGREAAFLRNAGTNTIYLAFNETAVADIGFYLEANDVLIINGAMASRAIHMVCAAGETASVYAELEA